MPRVWDKLGEMLTAEHRQFSSVFAALSLWARSQVRSVCLCLSRYAAAFN